MNNFDWNNREKCLQKDTKKTWNKIMSLDNFIKIKRDQKDTKKTWNKIMSLDNLLQIKSNKLEENDNEIKANLEGINDTQLTLERII